MALKNNVNGAWNKKVAKKNKPQISKKQTSDFNKKIVELTANFLKKWREYPVY